MATLKEFKQEYDFSNYADVFIFEDTFSKNIHKWHGDYITLLDDVEEEREIIDYEEMTPDDMNRTYYANASNDANDIYNSDDVILFVKVAKN